ncbi:MAG: hypothetical protein L0H93_17620 [Nocardioides sp.]|nr:hypothetical protein [Nocardioides sp.]
MSDDTWEQRRGAHEAVRKALPRPPRPRTREHPVPERITTALDICGLDGPEVDEALGGAEPMVDEWEAGQRIPTEQQIVTLAELTGFTVDFFHMPIDPEDRAGGIWMCQRSGPGKGCTYVEPKPGPSDAPVVDLHPDTLF